MTAQPSITRAVTPADFADIRPLIQAHIEYERSVSVAPADWPERMARLVAGARLVVFTARVEGTPVGYASVTTDVETWTGDEYAQLDCLYLADGRRGSGIGRLLMQAVVEHSRGRGLGELQWQTPEWNAGAIRFYESLGASHTGKERFTLKLGEFSRG